MFSRKIVIKCNSKYTSFDLHQDVSTDTQIALYVIDIKHY